MPDEDELNEEELQAMGYRVLPLQDEEQRKILLLEEDHAWAAQWTWHYDPETNEAARYLESGEKILLYHEMVRRHRQEGDLVSLTGKSVQRIFGNRRSYQRLRLRWAEQTKFAVEHGIELPSLNYFIAAVLTLALNLYFTWVEETGRTLFHEDPEKLLPGHFTTSLEEKPHYRTLGAWMKKELTGDWHVDPDASTGMLPQSFQQKLHLGAEMMFDALADWEEQESADGEVDMEEIWEFFRLHELDLDQSISLLLQTLEGYETPYVG